MNNTRRATKVTLHQVAIKARVSTATVSRSLAFPEKVSQATRLRVEQAAYELGYLPFSCRHLRQNASRTILVLIPDICDPSYQDTLRGIEITAARHGYLVITGDCAHQEKQEKNFIDFILACGIMGILVMNGQLPAQASGDEKRHLPPIVMANDFVPQLALPSVQVDNLSAAFNAVDYLYQSGHRQIACIAGPQQISAAHYRLQGYSQALTRRGQKLNPAYIRYASGDYTGGQLALAKLLALPDPPTAVFCHNDMMALGALSCAKQQKIRVPEQLSLTGFGNILMTELSDPPLTTMAQPCFDIGREAMLLLIDKMLGKEVENAARLLECRLIVRGSTCAV